MPSLAMVGAKFAGVVFAGRRTHPCDASATLSTMGHRQVGRRCRQAAAMPVRVTSETMFLRIATTAWSVGVAAVTPEGSASA